MRTTVAISLAALTLLAACSKSGGSGDQASSAGASSSSGSEKITLAQFQQRQVDRIMRDDANKDGKVSKDEFVQAMQARIAERQTSAPGSNAAAAAAAAPSDTAED